MGYIDKISASTGVYDICALSAKSASTTVSAATAESAETVTSFANVTPYEYEAPDKTHKGLKFTNGDFVGVVEIGSTGNMTLEAIGISGDSANTGNANIEAAKQIKLKPTTKIQLDSSRRIVSKGKNEVNVEAIFNDYGESGYSQYAGSDEQWAQAFLYGRSWDITCMEHGGVAVQPAGADSDDHINKVKFEHSMKVSVEHFGEYELTPASTTTVYDFPEGEWVCLCEVLNERAVQIYDSSVTQHKILDKTNTKWNNAMKKLNDDYCGIDFDNVQLAVGYAAESGATEIINGGVDETVMASAITGQYIFVKRIAIEGASFSGISAVAVLNTSPLSADTTKFYVNTEEDAIEIVAAANGAAREVTTNFNIVKGDKTYAVDTDSTFTIEGIKYIADTANTVVYPQAEPAKTYAIVDDKFEITPCYPVHFNTQGGKGVEWGTFNPLHTSLYSADYRFKEDAPVYAVTRGELEIGTKKCDYPTQEDDTKDILDEAKKATWEEIVNVARDYADGNLGKSVADEHISLEPTKKGANMLISLSGDENNLKIISEKNINLNAAAKARICAAALDVDYELSTNDENTTEIEGYDTNFTYTFKNNISTADTAFETNSGITVSEEFAGVVEKTSVGPTISKKGLLQREYTLSVPVRDVILGVEKIKELLDKVADLEARVEALEAEQPVSGSTEN